MSHMLTNTKRVVEEDVSNRATQMSVLFEAITNAVHANAKRIVCRLSSTENLLNTKEGEVVERKIDEIEVEDNGDGFGDLNFASFGEYRTDHKQEEFGCKGVGRFVFLKVYRDASYTSYLLDGQEKKSFNFDFDFESDNAESEDFEVVENKTTLFLSGVRNKYFDLEKGIDRRLEIDLATIRKKVLLHLIPTLFFYKRKNHNVHIDFVDTGTSESVSITSDDVPEFEETSFEIPIENENVKSFTLYHEISNDTGGLHAYYCANRRTVCEFSEKDFKVSLPQGFSGYLLLESKYLNDQVDNQRNDFTIYPVKTDWVNPLSWKDINACLKRIISTIITKEIPNAGNINRAKLNDIQEVRPYLVSYIDEEDLDMAGFIDEKQIINKAKKRFDRAKEKLIKHAGKKEYTDQDLQDAIQVAQNELVAYVCDRVMIIDRLKTMLDNKEQSEEIIHNLFMERYTDDDYFCTGKNNLWLLDDRFTNYSYAASEKRIKGLLEAVDIDADTGIDGDRPDLALFFSQNPLNKKGLKSVLIELKSFDYNSKSDRKKYAGVQQLLDYIKAFQAKEEIEEIWAFLVTDVDDEFAERLKMNDYNPLFSTEREIYHRYYSKINASIYVIGARTLVFDAEARNKVFIDIINKQSKLSKLISEDSNSVEVDSELEKNLGKGK